MKMVKSVRIIKFEPFQNQRHDLTIKYLINTLNKRELIKENNMVLKYLKSDIKVKRQHSWTSYQVIRVSSPLKQINEYLWYKMSYGGK